MILMLAAGHASAQRASFPAYTTAPVSRPVPAVAAESIAKTPLKTEPYVFHLEHRDPGAMSGAAKATLRERWPELVKRAGLFQLDLNSSGWSYKQTLCPSFPGYLLLSFQHGANPSGSSRFVAVLEKDGSGVQIIPSYAHGARPFLGSWKKAGTYEVFNRMLRKQRGSTPISDAKNWLVIGMCYAELSGFPVQVLTPRPIPGSMMDVLRLKASQPQMLVSPDKSAEIMFSDIARPAVTANWVLHFNREGQITSAARNLEKQPSRIALRP